MQQQPQIPPVNKNKTLLAVVISIVATTLVVGAAVYFFLNGCPKLPEANNTTPNETASQFPEMSARNKTVYFGKGSDGKYSLVNVQTGETQEFIPAGYTLVTQWGYQTFPSFLILQKENALYSYSVEDKIVNSIFGFSNARLELKKNEQATIHSSITEKDKFLIQIDTLDLSQVSDMDGSSPVLSTRTYSFDASTNRLHGIANVRSDSWIKYDSKNQRLYIWPGGEGVQEELPFSIYDLKGNFQKKIISTEDFGPPYKYVIRTRYNNGLFFAFNNGRDIKIIIVNPSSINQEKEIYTADEEVKSQISEAIFHSLAIDRSTKTLIVGGSSYILLLRFDKKNQITQSKYIPEQEIYANFIFVNAGKLYYQAKDNIRVVNLTSWRVEKSIPSPDDHASLHFSEITLFAF